MYECVLDCTIVHSSQGEQWLFREGSATALNPAEFTYPRTPVFEDIITTCSQVTHKSFVRDLVILPLKFTFL